MSVRRMVAGMALLVLAVGGWLAFALLTDDGQVVVEPIDLRTPPEKAESPSPAPGRDERPQEGASPPPPTAAPVPPPQAPPVVVPPHPAPPAPPAPPPPAGDDDDADDDADDGDDDDDDDG